MKGSKIAVLLCAFATAGSGAPAGQAPSEPPAADFARIDSVPAGRRLHGFDVVSDDTLIVWTTPRKPYLVRLFRPSRELRFASTIGVTSFGNRIHARFDAVEVNGFSYPIREIHELSRDEAKTLGRAGRDPAGSICRAASADPSGRPPEPCAS